MNISRATWRNLKFGFPMFIVGALLAACGGGGGGASAVAECDATYQTVLKTLPAAAAAVTTNKKSVAAVPAGTLRIHYQRTDAYTGWSLYTYSPEVMGGWPGKAFDAAGVTGSDAFGVYWDAPVAAATTVNFIIHKGGNPREPSSWSGKTGTDEQQFWTMANGNEIWKVSGDSANYTVNPDTIVPDVSTVRVHYKRFDGNYSKFGLNMWTNANGSGIDDAALATAGVPMPGWGDATNFADMPNYTTDDFGVVFEIPVVNPTTAVTPAPRKAVEFQIHGDAAVAAGTEGDKDGWGDNNIKATYKAMTISNQVADIWLVQETASVYYAKPDLRSVSTSDAKAYALNKELIKWPRVDSAGTFKLYYSATGQIKAALDGTVSGADGSLDLEVFGGTVPTDVATRFKFVAPGVVLNVKAADLADDAAILKTALTKQVLLVQTVADKVQNATTVQLPGALDDLYAAAEAETALGATVAGGKTDFKLWAPTAQKVSVCVYSTATGAFTSQKDMTFDPATGIWSAQDATDLTGSYYKYAVTVFVRGSGLIRNLVTDPYSISLTTDSKRSYIGDLSSAALKPDGWDAHTAPVLAEQEDMSVYEMHVRDFSASDDTVTAPNRGKYLAFTEGGSNGMTHLKALQAAGLTDVHLMPVFDIATINEQGCTTPSISAPGTPDSEAPQATVVANQQADCYNWGYDPYHFTALEGSYATNAADGAVRVKEFRQAVMALHAAGLRVGMDLVYNHTTAGGQDAKSVLDRIVPGYYQRLNNSGGIETSTCCANTATENLMMGKLMIDSVTTLATQYKLDSFRFDLMGHQPRTVMEDLKATVDAATGRNIFILGEGWNFGEVGSGTRFVQASQLSLNGSGIGTFSDRARDAIRGGGPFDSGTNLVNNQGFINGLYYDKNATATGTLDSLKWANDMVKVGLAGSIRSFSMTTKDDTVKTLENVDYSGQPAGYVTDPQEVVNYNENHDNQTLFDINAYKMPVGTPIADRVRAQMLGVALTSFSQGIAYYHAGLEILRSKSMDRDSYDSGDWFNKFDFTYTNNNFGVGAPIDKNFSGDDKNGSNYSIIKPILATALIKPAGADISSAFSVFKDIVAIRKSSTLFRMRTGQDIKDRLHFYNTGSAQEAALVVAHMNGVGYAGANFSDVMYFINVDKVAKTITIDAEKAKAYALHTAQANGSDTVVKTASYNQTTGEFTIPARTAAVFTTPTP